MNLFVTILLTLLVILAALFYLLKVKNENAGPFYRWSGLLVLAAAAALLTFLIFKGVKRLVRHDHRDHREMQMRKEGKKSRMRDKHCNGMHECNEAKEGHCCHPGEGESGTWSDSTVFQKEVTVDTTDGKITRKEIRIIKKEE